MDLMDDLVARAKDYAVRAHGAQTHGNRPIVLHLDTVSKILIPYGREAQTIGYLHDVVEDTEVSREDISREFGEFIAECVSILTDEDDPKREHRKAGANRRLAEVKPEHVLALVVKVADRLANLQSCVEQGSTSLLASYKKEHPWFRLSAYRANLCDEIWEAIETLLDTIDLEHRSG
jgi:(p)ppGpp synthase/HD superfamily hydrolase